MPAFETAVEKLKNDGIIYLGTDRATSKHVCVPVEQLATHLLITGTTGVGKTMLMAWLVALLAEIPGAAVIVIDPKGDIVSRASRMLVKRGHTKRMILVDPRLKERIVGYDLLKPNGLPPIAHVKKVREAILASSQTDLDLAQQLARYSLMALASARAHNLTLREAVDVLRPASPVRTALLARAWDPTLSEIERELRHFDELTPSRQDEVAASTVARLSPFIVDPHLRRIVTQREHSLDLTDVMVKGEIVLVNLAKHKALAPRDAKMFGRVVVNDVLAHAAGRKEEHPSPVFLVIDEVQDVLTSDLMDVLSQGRSQGLHVIAAHQYLEQFRAFGDDGILKAFTNCARSKMIFRIPDTDDCERFAKLAFYGDYDPTKVTNPALSRTSKTRDRSRSLSATLSAGTDAGEGTAESEGTGKTKGKSATTGAGVAAAKSSSAHVAHATSQGLGHADVKGMASVTGSATTAGGSDGWGGGDVSGSSGGFTTLPNGEVISTTGDGFSSSSFASGSSSWSDVDSKAEVDSSATVESIMFGESDVHGASESDSVGASWSTAETASEQTSESRSQSASKTKGTHQSASIQAGTSEGEGERIEPLSKEDFFTLMAQRIFDERQGEFILVPREGKAIAIKAPFIEIPDLTDAEKRAAVDEVLRRPCYATPEEITREEAARLAALGETGTRDEGPARRFHPKTRPG